MPNIEVKLESDLPFNEFVSSETKEIVDSRSFRDGNWKSLSRQKNFPNEIIKSIFPVNISYANFVVLTEVEAGASIPSHTHDEPMFRLVLEGSFDLNGKQYVKGEWVFVPPGVPYEMSTQTGYTSLGCYGMECSTK